MKVNLLALAMLIAVALALAAAPATAAIINTYTGSSAPFTSNISVTHSSAYQLAVGQNLANGRGFSGSPPLFNDSDSDGVPEHNSTWSDMWLSNPGGPAKAWVRFTLDADYDIDYIRVWNYNQSGFSARGVATATVWYSTAETAPAGTTTPGGAGSGWTQVGGTFSITKAPGANGYDGITDLALSGVTARHILIKPLTSHGDNTFAGLSEVQFFEEDPIPEPGTLVLLAGGAMGLLLRRRVR